MSRFLSKLCLAMLLAGVLVACSDDQDNSNNVDANDESNETNKNEEESDETVTDNESAELLEDQLKLSIGDTGTIHNNFSKHEITLNSFEIKDEAGGEPSQVGNYVIVDLTVKNLGDGPLKAEDALGSTELAIAGEKGGMPWFFIEGVAEEWPDEIEPGESQTGVLLFDIQKNVEYALQTGFFHSDSLTNKISFVFSADEAK